MPSTTPTKKNVKNSSIRLIAVSVAAMAFAPPLITAVMLGNAPLWLINVAYSVSVVSLYALGAAVLISILFLVISTPFLFSKKLFAVIWRACVVSLCLTGSIAVGLIGSESIRTSCFAQLAERSKPLIEAIVKYQQLHGHPPNDLEDLVPQFLPAVPNTGLARYPSYLYSLNPAESVPWELKVECPQVLFNWDVFFYWPTRNYPRNIYGGYVEQIRDWAYVHE